MANFWGYVMNDKHLEVLKEKLAQEIDNYNAGVIKTRRGIEAYTYAITQLEKPRLEELDEDRAREILKNIIDWVCLTLFRKLKIDWKPPKSTQELIIDQSIIALKCQKFGTRKVSVEEIEKVLDDSCLHSGYKEDSKYDLEEIPKVAQAIHDLIYIGKVKGE